MENHREREMKEIWESFRPCFKSDLERIDFRTRAMVTEMQTMGVRKKMIQEMLPKMFAALWNEVAEEGLEGYERRRA